MKKPRNYLFSWDELDFDLAKRTPEDLFRINAEGSWLSVGFIGDPVYGMPVGEVRSDGRHIALECWAPNKKAARAIFRQQHDFAEWEKEDAE